MFYLNERAQIWEQESVLLQSRQTPCIVDPSANTMMTKYSIYSFKVLAGRKLFQPRRVLQM